MKMKNVFSMKIVSAAVVAGIVVLASCQKDNSVLSATDTQSVNSEATSASYTSETSDMSSTVISGITDTKYGSGRTDGDIPGLGSRDNRLTGAIITIVPGPNSNKLNPSGMITIDFGTGQLDARGVTRSGKIVITYSGRKMASGSTRVLTYVNFSRNGTKIEGIYTVTNESDSTSTSIKLHHVLAGGKVTFGDGTSVTRNSDIHVVWNFVKDTPAQSTFTHLAGGTANGTNKNAKEYAMLITKDLVHNAACLESKVFIAVSGTKTITVTGGSVYTVDYGDGTCDNIITVTVNGKSKLITVNGDGN